MEGVVGLLEFAAALRLVDRHLHRLRHLVGVEDDAGIDVAGRAADGLHQRRGVSQEPLLVGVHDRHERHLGEIEPFAEEVDADEDVELPLAQLPEEIDPLEGVELAVEPAAADVALLEVGRQVLGEFLRERRDEDAVAGSHGRGDLAGEVRNLIPRRDDLDDRVEEPRRPDHLFDDLPTGAGQFPLAGRGRDVDCLVELLLPFVKLQRPVVHGAGEAEAMVDERRLPALVTGVHSPDLRHGDVRLVDEEQVFLGEIVEQRLGRAAWGSAGEGARVVFDPRAEARLEEHLEVEAGAGGQTLRLEKLPLRLELLEPHLEFLADRPHRGTNPVLRHDEVPGRVEVRLVLAGRHFPAGRMGDGDRLDRVSPELDPGRELLVGGPNVDRVAADAEPAPLQGQVAALVVDRDQFLEQLFPRQGHARGEADDHRPVVVGRTEAVNARHAGDDDDVAPTHQGAGGGQPQPVDLLVDGGILFDVDVALRDVGLGLVVVVVADEVVDGVVGKEVAELRVQLGREGLVVGEDERRPADPGDAIGHRERLAGAGHAHEDLRGPLLGDPADEALDGGGLIPRRGVGADEFEDTVAGDHRGSSDCGDCPGSGRRWGRRRARVASPTPGTSRSDSGDWKGPWRSR